MKRNHKINSTTQLGTHLVPGIWNFYFPDEFFKFEIPLESKATCLNCPKIKTDHYSPEYRCCTFQPRIPNFNIGYIIEESTKTSKIIEQMIEHRYLLPDGLIPSPARWKLFLDDQMHNLFGKSERVKCEFLDKSTKLCQIYAHRNGPCSTFFCEHDNKKNESFWDSIALYINQMENRISQWVMEQLGISPQKYFHQLDMLTEEIAWYETKELGWPLPVYKKLWSHWHQKESLYFKEASLLIEKNSENLIEIAKKQKPLEASFFEDHIVKTLPDGLEKYIDEHDSNVEHEEISLDYLYKLIKFDYREMKSGQHP